MKKIMRINLILSLLCVSSWAGATDLMQVYQDAFNNNPTFLAAKSTALSQMQGVPIARAGLLPAATFVANDGFTDFDNRSQNDRVIPLPNGQNLSLQGENGTFRYNTQNYVLAASQPIFDFANWFGYTSAKSTANAASATFNYALQTLISTTAQAYFNVLDAEDNLTYVQAEKQAYYESLTQAQQKFEVGLIAITDVEQARSQYDGAVAQELAAENNVRNTKESLRAITGVYYDHLASLRNNTAPLLTPQPVNVDKWVETADKQNWNLISYRQTAEAAHKTEQAAQAGHLPVLNGVADYTANQTGTTASGQINNREAYVGMQLTIPIFENGMGYVSATAKQAAYNYQTAIQNRNNAYLSTVTDTRQSFNDVMSYISQVEADKQTIKSSQVALQSIIDGYEVGTETMLDVLNQQQTLYSAWSTYSTDQYSYINSTIALKQAAGTLSPVDLQQLNSWLTEERTPFTNTLYTTENQSSIPKTRLGGGKS
ncbi:MAG: TolC family outer membrane protein [Gammaproteobacteria bacterium]|nr:TolC family outer membrane protein [Gammaproteobacteria bacterium]MBY0544946.1 TolC family outer membrane protein [Gammaproteobacteria bacterium]